MTLPAEWTLRKTETGFVFACNLPVLPAVRQNRNSRWGPNGQRARDYNAAKNAIHDLLVIAMKQKGIEPSPKDARLAIKLNIWKGGFQVWIEEIGHKPDKGYLKGDWDNLAKCVCDSMQGVAFANDSQIDSAGVGLFR